MDNILFFGGNEATDRWVTLKDQLSAKDQKKPHNVFKVFANSLEKSSLHWQARDECLSDIKQGKRGTKKIDTTRFTHIDVNFHITYDGDQKYSKCP